MIMKRQHLAWGLAAFLAGSVNAVGFAYAEEEKLLLFVDIQTDTWGANREVDLDVLRGATRYVESFNGVECIFEPAHPEFVDLMYETLLHGEGAVPAQDRLVTIRIAGKGTAGASYSEERRRTFYAGASEPVGYNINEDGLAQHLCVFTIDTPL